MSIVNERLKSLRREMNKNGISACIIPTSDPHISEYIAECYKYREYFSGFNGSAGTLFVTLDKAFLLTDGRYFLQAEKQLLDTDIELIKSGVEGQPDLFELCTNNLSKGASVFADPHFFSANLYEKIKDKLSSFGINLSRSDNPITSASNMPSQSFEEIYELKAELSGIDRLTKLASIRQKMSTLDADGLILTSLDDIAWLYNLRGNDIQNAPLFYAYSYVTHDKAFLFADSSAIKTVTTSLLCDRIEILDYNSFIEFVSEIPESKIIADKNSVNAKIAQSLPDTVTIISSDNPVYALKAVKNDIEIQNMRNVHIYDGIALVKFMRYIKSVAGKNVSEISASDKLYELRRKNVLFNSNSFETISAYAENAAIIHYSPTEETNKQIEPLGALLVDSGGQYTGGTTDVTRMFILGETSPEFKRDYTLVCKAMLKLQGMHFPLGTKGAVIDGVVRESLWRHGIDFRHGTGHGIGYMLSVHEGPNRISFKDTSSEILPGTVTSDEPGIYIDGKYGIRMENTLLCVEAKETEFGKFCRFEPLTLCPIDLDAIDISFLTNDDIDNLNEYHKLVYDKLSPFMSEDDVKYLETVTRQI